MQYLGDDERYCTSAASQSQSCYTMMHSQLGRAHIFHVYGSSNKETRRNDELWAVGQPNSTCEGDESHWGEEVCPIAKPKIYVNIYS